MTINKSNENLFNVDVNAIKSTLENANQILKEDGKSLTGKYELLPANIVLEKDFDESNAYIEESENFLINSKQFRLANGKPFREAAKVINDYYKLIDEPIEQELRIVKERINTKAREEYEIRKEHEEIEADKTSEVSSPMITSSDGEIIVEASQKDSDESMVVELNNRKVKMHYKVSGYDLKNLDFNELKSYFTEASILTACKKHLKNENRQLSGVEYKAIAVE